MPYRIDRSQPIAAEVRRVASEQLERATREIDDAEIDVHQTVHQVRKRCKKLRGLVRLVRPGCEKLYQRENAAFRDAAKILSELRDRKTVIAAYDRLMEHFSEQVNREAFGSIRGELTRRLNELANDHNQLQRRLEDFAQRVNEAAARIEDWDLSGVDVEDLAGGLKKTYARGRKAMAKAYANPTAERFHEWRKRLKYHWYHTRLVEEAWPQVMKAYQSASHEASNLLGDAHDFAVLRNVLLEAPEQFGAPADVEAFVGLADRRRAALQTSAQPLGRRLFADQPKQLARRFKALCAADDVR